jgi:hypothetical protein
VSVAPRDRPQQQQLAMNPSDSFHTQLPVHTCRQGAAASAAEDATAAAVAPAPDAASTSTSSSSSSSAPSPVLQQFVDNEYELQYPSNYTYKETPIVRVERGPQPERSPVLGRFEAPNGEPGTISVLMRRANALKQTILQVCVGVVCVGVRQQHTGWGRRHASCAGLHVSCPCSSSPRALSGVLQATRSARARYKLLGLMGVSRGSSTLLLCVGYRSACACAFVYV